ncbi:MAG: FAD-binding protein [Oscillospiraceae bacterium]|nr:FAD-binding protein [Oscillospiraceae bacterium]
MESGARTPAWLGEEPEIKEAEIKETVDTQLLTVGAGTAGLTATATAVDCGVKTLLIEANKSCTPVRKEIGAVGSRIQKEENCRINIHELVREMTMYSTAYADQRLLHIWARESGEAIDRYESIIKVHGAVMTLQGGYGAQVKEGSYTKFPTGHKVRWPNGVSGAGILCEYAEKRGAEIRMQTALIKLIKEGKRVTGAVVKDLRTGRYIRVNASKGVVISTGGYVKNTEMLKALQAETLALSGLTVSEGATMGDGIKACLWAGAKQDDRHLSIMFDRCALMPDETPEHRSGPGKPTELITQPFLKVDLTGRRFCNESQPYDFIAHRALSLPGKCYCVLFDSGFADDARRFDMAGCSRMFEFENGAPCGHDIEENIRRMGEMQKEGRFVKADTIPELAGKLGLPAAELEKTVARYNELFDMQSDEDFGKEAHRLSQMRRPPYFGVRACSFLLGTLDGVRIDENMNATDENAEPIPGLYVCGNDSGGFFANSYVNLATGCCAGRNMTFAARAARIIAGS